jgi:hypothetical protein
VFLGSVFALKRTAERFGPARLGGCIFALALGVASHAFTFGAMLPPEGFFGNVPKVAFKESTSDRRAYADFRKLTAKIPEKASVAATEREVPHVAARLDCYTLSMAHGDADYLLIRHGEVNDVVKDAFQRNTYGLVSSVGNTFYLFQKGFESPKTAAAKENLGIP